MGFKDGCCGLCAWFSVIGAFTYFTLGQMIINRNQPVIEHKFKMRFSNNDEALGQRATMMYEMAIVMVAASFACFFMQKKYSDEESEQIKVQKEKQKQEFYLIFQDEKKEFEESAGPVRRQAGSSEIELQNVPRIN